MKTNTAWTYASRILGADTNGLYITEAAMTIDTWLSGNDLAAQRRAEPNTPWSPERIAALEQAIADRRPDDYVLAVLTAAERHLNRR